MEQNKLDEKFLQYCKHHNFFDNTKKVVACVSGGVDSMVMLTLMVKFSKKFGFDIIVTHFNHQSRGKLSDNDETLVSNFCNQKNLKIFIKSYNVMKFAEDKGISFEMAGRDLRYKFFNEIAEKYKNVKIATAHILNDHTETILLRIFNGSGLNGLLGIHPKRNKIIRPILFAQKSELYQYAIKNEIPFNDDHTNFENDCMRNIIRNKIIPIISKEINPNIDNSLKNLSKIVSDNLLYIKNIASEKFYKISTRQNIFEINLNLLELQKLDSVIRNEVLLKSFQEINSSVSTFPGFNYMEQIDYLIKASSTGKFIKIFDEIFIVKNRDVISIVNEKLLNWEEQKIIISKIYNIESFIFSSEMVKFDEFSDVNNSNEIEHVDLEKIKGSLKLRHWQIGDRFIPFGNRFQKKLSDFFIDEKVSRFTKQQIPILVDEEKIIWICGMRLSNEVRISKKTKQILKISYKEI